MSQSPTQGTKQTGREPGAPLVVLDRLGAMTLSIIASIGGALLLAFAAWVWIWKAVTRRRVRTGRAAIVSQICRVGVASIGIVCLVSGSVGLILALQLAPPLDDFGQRDLVANIISVAVLRELGPLIGAIVLTGFAGASIAAEIGTMVVSEEIEALEAMALNPVRFLVVPRVLAATISMAALSVFSSIVAIASALWVSVVALDIPYDRFITNMLSQAKLIDFMTGTAKGAIFGVLIGVIACYNGLKVTGGASGVGRATTMTVVASVIAIIMADLVFTTIFFALKLY
jgi:phospholipid/cholesterol/gamma-HCH transport system permease protein